MPTFIDTCAHTHTDKPTLQKQYTLSFASLLALGCLFHDISFKFLNYLNFVSNKGSFDTTAFSPQLMFSSAHFPEEGVDIFRKQSSSLA